MAFKRTFLLLALITTAATACSTTGSGARNSTAKSTANPAQAQIPTVNVTEVVSQQMNRQLRLPGELQPFQDVAIYARVPGFVEAINVDRGSVVRHGQLLARLRAPELDTQRGEAEAKTRGAQSQRVEAAARVNGARAQRLEAEAKLAAEEATYQRLKAASATPGAVAGNDLEVALHTVEASRARVQLWGENEKAAQAQLKAIEENERAVSEAARTSQNIEAYLRITAPFDGVITERNVHPGSLAGTPGGSSAMPMLRLQQVSRLRLVVAVPESEVTGITPGAKVNFTVPALPGEQFTGVVRRVSRSLDTKTRTMPVELDVDNARGRLAPGMFPEVTWPARRPRPSLFVPPSAVAVTTERTFVIRLREGQVEWVDVRRGVALNQAGGDLVEVFGDLAQGDLIAVRGTDELRAGTKVNVKQQGGK
ncbi:MAG: efflux RND transporter periplasmic adaptor subunit [Acidobacteria bacterium]|nr:efflux RND transporter periplasmic adaptor subunit [Acidobacteriota bacterium]